ncbi:hypothetical protein PI95_001310 [Hassallia byssoidea VB512170]|uniref:Uncharacterized protein n=1 Tax=Hassallia byssoidea VB512170 TaxID=1304833 RepID=A0A846H1V4_9CYAN|nr:hypothetical protein [Hassalia byssoidea]NEU71253.1 hypothetical protein [Hassalia byssoidea VB512170]
MGHGAWGQGRQGRQGDKETRRTRETRRQGDNSFSPSPHPKNSPHLPIFPSPHLPISPSPDAHCPMPYAP